MIYSCYYNTECVCHVLTLMVGNYISTETIGVHYRLTLAVALPAPLRDRTESFRGLLKPPAGVHVRPAVTAQETLAARSMSDHWTISPF